MQMPIEAYKFDRCWEEWEKEKNGTANMSLQFVNRWYIYVAIFIIFFILTLRFVLFLHLFCLSCHVKHITRLFIWHIASSKNFQRAVPGICVKQLKWNVACVCVFISVCVSYRSFPVFIPCVFVCVSHSSFDFYFPLNGYRKFVFDILQAGFNGNKNMSKPIN